MDKIYARSKTSICMLLSHNVKPVLITFTAGIYFAAAVNVFPLIISFFSV